MLYRVSIVEFLRFDKKYHAHFLTSRADTFYSANSVFDVKLSKKINRDTGHDIPFYGKVEASLYVGNSEGLC